MDVRRSADDMRSMLVAHDKAAQQFSELESYISQLGHHSFSATVSGSHDQTLRTALRLSTATGIKQMYESYLDRKWSQIQTLARNVMSQLEGEEPLESVLEVPRGRPVMTDPAAGMLSSTFCEGYRRD